jgi:gluconate:H+ symporter, GntP family
MPPLLILALSMLAVLGLILVGRVHAFLALLAAGLLVGLLSPLVPAAEVASALATDFGTIAGRIGIMIALASIIGTGLLESGAAARIVRTFVDWLGERRAHYSMWASSYVLSVPVFFDTVFFLLLPLARAMHARTGQRYLIYLMALMAGGAATHVFVPPTPGPLAGAAALQVDLGLMIVMGIIVALPASLVGVAYAAWFYRRRLRVDPQNPDYSATPLLVGSPEEPPRGQPSFLLALTPIVIPVVFIASRSITQAYDREGGLAEAAAVVGDPNMALALAAVVALWLFKRARKLSLRELAGASEAALGAAGVIILITAAGGAYGSMLARAGVGASLQELAGTLGIPVLWLAFLLASLLKTAQGSSTVAIITAAGVLATLYAPGAVTTDLPNPVYVALACGAGSLVVSWMNDSGFWLISKMGGFTERQTFGVWTVLVALVGTTGFLIVLLLNLILPLRG